MRPIWVELIPPTGKVCISLQYGDIYKPQKKLGSSELIQNGIASSKLCDSAFLFSWWLKGATAWMSIKRWFLIYNKYV